MYSFYIGLDIDGVLCPDRFRPPMDEMTSKKVAELFQPDKSGKYTPLQWKQAASYFLDKEAMKIFMTHLVEKIEAFVKERNLPVSVGVILTSNWRNSVTLNDLKTHVFNRTAFADRIVAKTLMTKKGFQK